MKEKLTKECSMEFYGLLGEKLSHSLSPQIHNRIFDLIGIEGAYKLFPIPKDKVKKVGESIKIFGIYLLSGDRKSTRLNSSHVI